MYAKIQLIGRMTKDIEVRQTEKTLVGNFTLAVDRNYKDKKDTSFFDCVIFGKTVEVLEKYVKKGQALHIEGEPVIETYKDKNGNNRKNFKIYVSKFTIIDWGKNNLEKEENKKEEKEEAIEETINDDDFFDDLEDLDNPF